MQYRTVLLGSALALLAIISASAHAMESFVKDGFGFGKDAFASTPVSDFVNNNLIFTWDSKRRMCLMIRIASKKDPYVISIDQVEVLKDHCN